MTACFAYVCGDCGFYAPQGCWPRRVAGPRRAVVPRSVTSPQGSYKFADFNSTFLHFQELLKGFMKSYHAYMGNTTFSPPILVRSKLAAV